MGIRISVFATIAIAMVLVGLPGCGYNDLQGLDEDTKATWSEVVNQYQRRADLVPNLVATVKGYAAHEKETLEGGVAGRGKGTATTIDARNLDAASMKKFEEAQGALGSALSRLLVVAEKYPDLKANENFR